MNQFFLFSGKADYCKIAYNDVLKMKNFHFYNDYRSLVERINSKFLQKLFDISNRPALKNVDFNKFWYNYFFEKKYTKK